VAFRAYVVDKQDDGTVRPALTTLELDDLHDGDVTIRVEWSTVNYKDALATMPDGGVARVSPLVPGVDLAGTVVGSATATPGGDLLVITERGYGKRTPVSEYPLHHRGGQGVFTLKVTDRVGRLAALRVTDAEDEEILLISASGMVLRTANPNSTARPYCCSRLRERLTTR